MLIFGLNYATNTSVIKLNYEGKVYIIWDTRVQYFVGIKSQKTMLTKHKYDVRKRTNIEYVQTQNCSGT
jgi:hypothetical protein